MDNCYHDHIDHCHCYFFGLLFRYRLKRCLQTSFSFASRNKNIKIKSPTTVVIKWYNLSNKSHYLQLTSNDLNSFLSLQIKSPLKSGLLTIELVVIPKTLKTFISCCTDIVIDSMMKYRWISSLEIYYKLRLIGKSFGNKLTKPKRK